MVQRTPAPKPGRPRDPDAPPKPKRPRDELGRPLSHEAENKLELEDYDSLSLEGNHRLGIEHLNAGRFFPAHEAWETCWKQAKGTDEAEFFKGLSQIGGGPGASLRTATNTGASAPPSWPVWPASMPSGSKRPRKPGARCPPSTSRGSDPRGNENGAGPLRAPRRRPRYGE